MNFLEMYLVVFLLVLQSDLISDTLWNDRSEYNFEIIIKQINFRLHTVETLQLNLGNFVLLRRSRKYNTRIKSV